MKIEPGLCAFIQSKDSMMGPNMITEVLWF